MTQIAKILFLCINSKDLINSSTMLYKLYIALFKIFGRKLLKKSDLKNT